MSSSYRFFPACLAIAVLMAGVTASQALAQDKAKDSKPAAAAKVEKGAAKVTKVMENDKVQVMEILLKPGDQYKAGASASPRVIRALRGGILLRTDADGKTQKVEWKTGQVRFFESVTPHSGKNIGKSDLHFYVVVLK